MKKLVSLIIAAILMLVTIFVYGSRIKLPVITGEKINEAYKVNTDQRNASIEVLKKVFDKDTAVVLGSSELSATDQIGFPSYLFGNRKSEMKMVLMGSGYKQCLHQATAVGAYSDILPKKKVVLILSPQWFTKNGLDPDAYASRFSERLYLEMMDNKNISEKLKKRLTKRLKIYLSSDSKQLERINLYERQYFNHNLNPVEHIKNKVFRGFMDFKEDYTLAKQLSSGTTADAGIINKRDINFQRLMGEAQSEGEKACTNNDFGVYDEYYNSYIKDNVNNLKNSNINESYAESPEYDDFKIFLDMCKELEIEPLIVIVPVNGSWYDYTGFPKSGREAYYSKVREICKEYNVKTADFSDKEYEKYFLKDIMHMGWKGWVYFDEAVFNFYNQ